MTWTSVEWQDLLAHRNVLLPKNTFKEFSVPFNVVLAINNSNGLSLLVLLRVHSCSRVLTCFLIKRIRFFIFCQRRIKTFHQMTNENVVATTTMVILNQCQNGHRLMVEPILRRIFFRLALITIGQLLGMGLHQRNICSSLKYCSWLQNRNLSHWDRPNVAGI